MEVARVPIPESFKCPITHDVMKDPVQTVDGQVYDRGSIVEWFNRGNKTSPMTGLPLPEITLSHLAPLQRAIEDWLATFPRGVGRELDAMSVQKAAEEIEDALHRKYDDLQRLSVKQRRAFSRLLLSAIKKGDAYVLQDLWEAGVLGAIDTFSRQKQRLSIAAVTSGHTDVVKALANIGLPMDVADSTDGTSLAHYAAKQGHAEMIQVLSHCGASLDMENHVGITPLMVAIQKKHIPVIRMLQRCGVKLHSANHVISHQMMSVASNTEGSGEVMMELWGSYEPACDPNALTVAAVQSAALGHIDNMNMLLHLGLQHDSLKTQWYTLLPSLAVFGSSAPAVLELLRASSVPLDTVDEKFEVFDFCQYWRKFKERDRQLRKRNNKDAFDFGVMDILMKQGEMQRLEIVFRNFEHRDLEVPEHIHKAVKEWRAARDSSLEADPAAESQPAKPLREFKKGAKHHKFLGDSDEELSHHINHNFFMQCLATLDNLSRCWKKIGNFRCEGQTAAHWAAIMGNVSAIKTLHFLSVSLESEDSAGCTPAHLGALMGHAGILEVLRSLNVPLDVVDFCGRDPADYAEQMGHIALAEKISSFDASRHQEGN